jgi:hypothetical protein
MTTVAKGILLMTLTGGTALAGGANYLLKEHLGYAWSNQVVSYAFSAPQGQCAAGSLRLSGPRGAQAVQLLDAVAWPGSAFVQSGRVAFVVDDLKPLTVNAYALEFSGTPAAPAALPTALSVTTNAGQAELTTPRFGARLPLGQAIYDPPREPGKVAGPVAALRLADGTWFGGSRLTGSTPVKSWSARLLESGPVVARVETVYTYADGNTLRVMTQLNAGDYAVQFDMEAARDRNADGWELLLAKGIGIGEGVKLTGMRYLAKEVPFTVDVAATAPFLFLNPWPGDGWFPDSPATVRLKVAGKNTELHLSVVDCASWVTPKTNAPWFNFLTWSLEGIEIMWDGWRSKRIPLSPAEGGIKLQMSLLSGRRKWTVGERPDGAGLLDAFVARGVGHYTPMPGLDEIKDLVLEWPDGPKHPYLFASADEIATMAKRNPKAYQDLTSLAPLTNVLSNLGAIDYFRAIMEVAVRYDMMIDSGKIPPADRPLWKARTAYMAYLVADPSHWSFERGCCSGNPNMTVSRTINVGFMGFALRDHPMSKTWTDRALTWTKYWLETIVDDSGSWPESAHYARVTWADFADIAILARQAGVHDFFKDPKFRKMSLFYEKTMLPPHPLRLNGTPSAAVRGTPLYGRGTRIDAWGGMASVQAALLAKDDPAFSAIMQWCWKETGYSDMFSHNTAGMTALLSNRDLPLARPDWKSEFLPTLGYLLRSHLGTPYENYLLFVTEYFRSPDGEIWPPDTGAIANWYALGKPVGGSFSRAAETTHGVTVNRVIPAMNWDPASGATVKGAGYVTTVRHDASAILPGLDYASVNFSVWSNRDIFLAIPKDMPALPKRNKEGSLPMEWRRQLFLVSDDKPEGITYMVLRDSVSGGQPSQWNFWTLSEKIGTPEDAKNRDAFLADKPGAKMAPLRELKGNRLTAFGQFGVDLDYFIAAPANTPRHTLRFGLSQGAYGVERALPEYQDLLYLQRPGDGDYFVALFPRLSDQPAPEFESLSKDRGMRITGTFGTDTILLTQSPAEISSKPVRLKGTAAMAQDRVAGLKLLLGAAGEVECRDYRMMAAVPATLSVTPESLSLALGAMTEATEITLEAPGKWKVAPGTAAGVTWTPGKGNRGTLKVPPATPAVRLVKK